MKTKFLLTTALSFCVSLLWAQIEITEVRTQGSNNGNFDIIELRGAPGYTIPAGTRIASIGASPDPGDRGTALLLGGMVFPADGILTLGKTSHYSPDLEGAVNLWSFGNMSIFIYVGDFPPTDVDTDDDGDIDADDTAGVFWTSIIDGITILEVPSTPAVPDYSSVLGITSISNPILPANIYRHIIKDPITGEWRGNRLNEDDTDTEDTFGAPNHSLISAPVSLTEDAVVSDLSVESGGTLTVQSDINLEVMGDVDNSGSVTFEAGASLIDAASTYTGSAITFKRTAQHAGDALRHSLVGSPVSGVNLTDLGGQQYYQYNEASDSWSAAGNPAMAAGQGYSVVGKTDLVFAGTPNTGSVAISATASSFKLLANPYPCAIDIAAFFAANTASLQSETIRIWNDNGSENGQRPTTDYLTVNNLGVAQSGSTGAKASTNFNEGKLGSMQGFFVETNGSGTSISFTDAMKASGDNDDAAFFRKSENGIQKFKLAVANKDYFSEVLLAFAEDATTGFDKQYDAKKVSGNTPLQLSALIGDDQYAILASPSLNHADLSIPMKFTAEAGDYMISIADLVNLPEGHMISLVDKHLGIVEPLNEQSYNFVTSKVQGSDRFEIVLSSGAPLAAADAASLNSQVEVYATAEGLGFASTSRFAKASIFDLQGKAVFTDLALTQNDGAQTLNVRLSQGKMYILKLDRDVTVKFLYK